MGMDVSGDDVAGESMTTDDILDLAKAWIERALSSTGQNDAGYYRKMLTDLREVRLEDPASVSALQLRLRVLSQSVFFINERHQALLDHLLGMSIWIYGGDVAGSLLEFVVNLATANGSFVGQCMDMLVRNFLPPSCGLPSFLDTYSKAGLMGGWLSMDKIRAQQNVHLARKENVLNHLHTAIKQITSLVPTIPLRMQPIVYRRMPHRSAAKEWNVLYLENMLRLENSGGHYMASQMLPAIIDHLIQIDVEIRWEDIMAEEDSAKVYMFHMDFEEETEEREQDGNETGDVAGVENEAKSSHGLMTRPSKDNVSTLDEMADKMDLMMDMILQHLQDASKRGQSVQVYETLMKSFQSTILHTHKSKFTQFLIFYLCSLAPITCGSRFPSLLCDIFTSRTHPPNTRMSAAAYLASYLARANYLSADVILTSLRRMVSWCIAYGDEAGIRPASTVPDAILHGVFFSVCQAVMYTLCFRFKMLTDDMEGKRVLRGLSLQQFVDHRLNPLKVCLQSVVEEFLKKASILQLVDEKYWLVTKERTERNTGGMSVGDIRLDMFFPFDPYLLRQSDRFIRPNFNFWYMVEPLVENDVSDIEDAHDDSGSDVSSDMESLPFELAESHSHEQELHIEHRIEGHVEDYQVNYTKSDSRTIIRSDATMRLDYNVEATSPYSDDGFGDTFQQSFDAMAITPPQGLRMPAKLPAQLPPNFSRASYEVGARIGKRMEGGKRNDGHGSGSGNGGQGSERGNKGTREANSRATRMDSGSAGRSLHGGFPNIFAGHPSLFNDMAEDPFFNDPFFTRPFGIPFEDLENSLIGPQGIFNQGLCGILGQGQKNLLDQRPHNNPHTMEGSRRNVQTNDKSRRGVQIEELSDDNNGVGHGPSMSNREPIVEHPDDNNKADINHYQPRSAHLDTSRHQSGRPSQSANSPISSKTYSFQSASVIKGGATGPYYAAQTTRRQGPGGVVEEEHQEKDTTTGNASHRISHGLGDKFIEHRRSGQQQQRQGETTWTPDTDPPEAQPQSGHSLVRKRNAQNQEEKFESLHNLGEEEVPNFERTWAQKAETSLPNWSKGSLQQIGSSSKPQTMRALPSNRSS